MAAETALPDNWERTETNTGIPYYINHNDGTTQWEHPALSSLLSDGFGAINQYKYATYRTAMKLRGIQNQTKLCNVNLTTLTRAFRELGHHQDHNNEVLQVVEVEAILSKIYHYACEEGPGGYNYSLLPSWAINKLMKKQAELPDIEPEFYTDVTLSWMLRCYDSGRTGVVKVHSLKIGLVALCHATIQEKYAYIFDLMSSARDQISFSNLRKIVQDLLQLPHNIGENKVFSVDSAADTAKSCWNYNGKQTLEYVSRDEFWCWMKKEPVALVWLPTLYRIATSETVKHEARCSQCKTIPIVGIRYRCLKCSGLDTCQTCYWTQVNTVKDHKITHPTREYCLATTTGDDVKDFAKQLKNKLTRKYRHKPPKKTYLDYTIDTDGMESEERDTAESLVLNNVHTRINNMAERLLALEEGGDEDNNIDPNVPDEVLDEPEQNNVLRETAIAENNIEARLRAEEIARDETAIAENNMEARLRAEEIARHETAIAENNIEARLRAEEIARDETRARQEAELQSLEMERQVLGLQEKNQELAVEVQRLTQLLQQKPKEVKVPFAIPPPPPKIPVQASPFVNTKSQAVNTLPLHDITSSSGTHSPREWATSYLGEQQELDSILSDLLTAFPSEHSTGVFATDLGHDLFIAASIIGTTLTTLVEQIASTQDS